MAQACSISGGCLPDWPQQSVQIFLTSDRSNNIPVYMLKLGGFRSRTMEIYYHWHTAEKGRQRTVKTFSRSFRAVYFMKDMSLIRDLRIIWQFFFSSSKPYYRLTLSYRKSVQQECPLTYRNQICLSTNTETSTEMTFYCVSIVMELCD